MATTSAASAAREAPSERLPLATRLAFGAGDLSPAIATIVIAFFQLFFLTTVAGLRPGAAGTILLVAKIWDAFTDPVMGWISDHTRSRHGRRRPWLLYGSVPFALVFFLQWIVPPFGQTGLFLYYLVMTLLLSTVFTIVNVPYTSLTPELTRDYDERTTLTSYRFAFSIGGSLIIGSLYPVLVGQFESQQIGYAAVAGGLAVLMILPFLWCFFGVRERYRAEDYAATAGRFSLIDQVKVAFGNRPYLFVIGIYLCSWLAVQIVTSVLAFYIRFWLGEGDTFFGIMILAVQGTAFVFLFVWSAVCRKIGKKAVYIVGMLFWIGVQVVLFFLQPGQLVLAVVLGVLAGVGVAVAYLIPWSMMPDVMEYDELQTGERREGVFYGFMVLLQKLGLALGLFLVSQALEWSGFDQNMPPAEQPESALLAIRVMIGPVPVVLLLVGIALASFYPITQQKHAELREQVAARRAAEGTGAE
jgi:GPH family glycoside/pentoside/hexuronide:cation symporter